ncbi:MAG: hypothetical protein WDZ40_02365 [Candidatus Spechtbacterales bacterium]
MADNQTLEQQLETLTQEIEKRKQLPVDGRRIESEPKPEKEHLHDIVGEKLYGETEHSPHEEERHEELPATHGGEEQSYNLPELHERVQKLVNSVFEKDLDSAVKEVRATDDAALIDAFHDALVDELHDHLVNTGKLEKL